MELLIAVILINFVILYGFFQWFSSRERRNKSSMEIDKDEIRALKTDFNRVINAHVNLLEDRKDQLDRVVVLARQVEDRIHRKTADLAVYEKRIGIFLERAEKVISSEPREAKSVTPASGKKSYENDLLKKEFHAVVARPELALSSPPIEKIKKDRKTRLLEAKKLINEGWDIKKIARKTKLRYAEIQMIQNLRPSGGPTI